MVKHVPGPKSSSGVTLRDVALAAGVSVSTASRALSGSRSVGKVVKARVEQAAADLQYSSNDLVRGMSGGGNRPLVFVTFGIFEPNDRLIMGLGEVVKEYRSTFMMYPVDSIDAEQRLIQVVVRQRPTGIVLGTQGAGTEQLEGFVARIPSYEKMLRSVGAMLVLCPMPHLESCPSIPTVDFDQVTIVRNAVAALIARGHRHVMFLGANDSASSQSRVNGFRRGMADAGLPLRDDMVVACDWHREAAQACAMQVLDRADRPTAIVAYNDYVAIGVYRAARELGIAIPGELSVVGFDDLACGVDLMPALSSIRAPFRAMGERAARFVFEGVPRGVDPHVTFSSKLILRDSVGPAPEILAQ